MSKSYIQQIYFYELLLSEVQPKPMEVILIKYSLLMLNCGLLSTEYLKPALVLLHPNK